MLALFIAERRDHVTEDQALRALAKYPFGPLSRNMLHGVG
jgi:hypothetical protein